MLPGAELSQLLLVCDHWSPSFLPPLHLIQTWSHYNHHQCSYPGLAGAACQWLEHGRDRDQGWVSWSESLRTWGLDWALGEWPGRGWRWGQVLGPGLRCWSRVCDGVWMMSDGGQCQWCHKWSSSDQLWSNTDSLLPSLLVSAQPLLSLVESGGAVMETLSHTSSAQVTHTHTPTTNQHLLNTHNIEDFFYCFYFIDSRLLFNYDHLKPNHWFKRWLFQKWL